MAEHGGTLSSEDKVSDIPRSINHISGVLCRRTPCKRIGIVPYLAEARQLEPRRTTAPAKGLEHLFGALPRDLRKHPFVEGLYSQLNLRSRGNCNWSTSAEWKFSLVFI